MGMRLRYTYKPSQYAFNAVGITTSEMLYVPSDDGAFIQAA